MGEAMTTSLKVKSSKEFVDPAGWREYVRAVVPDEDVHYVLAFERTQLFLNFCKLRGLEQPVEVTPELDRIAKLNEPGRTEALKAFNDMLLASATMRLMSACKSHSVTADSAKDHTEPHKWIDTLLDHLGRTNPCYRLWRHYIGLANSAGRVSWAEFVAALHSLDASESTRLEEECALLTGQLGQLLAQYRDNNQPLPPFSFERIWFLNWLRGSERNLQARAVVQELIEAMKPCASA